MVAQVKVKGAEFCTKYEVPPQMAYSSFMMQMLNDVERSQQYKNEHYTSVCGIVTAWLMFF